MSLLVVCKKVEFNWTRPKITQITLHGQPPKKVQEIIINDYEPESKTKDKPKVIEFLKNKVSNMLERIKKLVSLQDDLYIESKNKLEIIQNRQDHSLEIKDESYFREQKQIERDDFDLEM